MTTVLITLAGFAFVAHAGIFLLGIALAWRQHSKKAPPARALPVTILKPLAGFDDGLEDNLRSFFALQHAAPFELVFSIDASERTGDAAALAQRLIAEHPAVSARFVLSARDAGDNPKIANLLAGAAVARHDLVLVSDANVRVAPDYLTRLTSHYSDDVGVVCSCIVGKGAESFGAAVDGLGLNTFYTRGMFLSMLGGEPAVPGKGMLFSTRAAERFGGLRSLLRYFAEDYLFGKRMMGLGLRIVATEEGLVQHMGRSSVLDYMRRQIRWSQIRRLYGGAAYAFELLTMNALAPAVLGGVAAAWLFGFSAVSFAAAWLAFELLCDLALTLKVGGDVSARFPLYWLAREALALPIWIATYASRHIVWRGKRLPFDREGCVTEPVDMFTKTKKGEPHYERRRFIMKKYPQIRSLMGHDTRTAWVTIAVVILQLALAWGFALLAAQGSVFAHPIAMVVYAYAFGAILTHWLSMTIHETSHDLAFKSHRANQALALLANIPMLVPIAMTFHRYHLGHHALLGVDKEDTDLPTRWEARVIRRSTVLKFLWLSLYFFVYSLRGLTFAKKPNRAEWLNIVFSLTMTALIVKTLGWTAFAYLAWSMFFAHSLHPVAAHFIHEHYIFSAPQETYSYYGVLNRVTFNVGYHVEHHDFMNVPGWKLPALHAMAGTEYSRLVSHKSWTLVLLEFIFCPRIGVDSRVVRSRAAFQRTRTQAHKESNEREHRWKKPAHENDLGEITGEVLLW